MIRVELRTIRLEPFSRRQPNQCCREILSLEDSIIEEFLYNAQDSQTWLLPFVPHSTCKEMESVGDLMQQKEPGVCVCVKQTGGERERER